MDRTWAAVPFVNTWDREVRQRSLHWQDLIDVLTNFRVASDGTKANVAAWSPALYREGTTRGKANVVSVSCLVLDYDSGIASINDALDAWWWRPGILHTSWSHAENHHRFRVILPLDKPIPVEDWPGVYAWADRWTRTCTNETEIKTPEDYATRAKWASVIDTQCKDPGRIYYLPAVRNQDWPRYAVAWTPPEGLERWLGVYSPWAREVKRHREEVERRKRPPAPPRVYHKAATRQRETDRRFRTDPGTRQRLGQALGGRVVGDAVRGVQCPRCNRSDVWWLINPDRKVSASCNHGSSCGWYGSLSELAALAGGSSGSI